MTDHSPKPASVGRYLWEALKFRWNLLFLAAGVGVAVLSGSPDIAFPLIAAAELAYLGGMSALPKYRAAIDAKVYSEAQPQRQASERLDAQNKLEQTLARLEPEAKQRLSHLRDRCLEMRRIAAGVRGQTEDAEWEGASAVNRMLWVFVRLLYSQQALGRFLASTDKPEILARLDELRSRQTASANAGDDRLQRAIVDSIATTELRLDNYQKAERNAEFVGVELDRIEGKIQALLEMSVSHEDPDYISRQVDSVAETIAYTETAIRELNQITGMSEELQQAPAILEGDLLQTS